MRAQLHPDDGPLRWSGTWMWRGAAVVLANREMDSKERTAAAESPDGPGRPHALASIAGAYRQTTGSAAESLNTRESLTPPRP